MGKTKESSSSDATQPDGFHGPSAVSPEEGANLKVPPKEDPVPNGNFHGQNESPWGSRLSRGSWRGKAAAIAEIAKESIPASTSSTESSPNRETPTRTAKRLSRTLQTPIKSSPIAASMTKLHVTSNKSEESSEPQETKTRKDSQDTAVEDTKAVTGDDLPRELHTKDGSSEAEPKERPAPAPSWRGWWSRPKEVVVDQNMDKPSQGPQTSQASTETPDAMLLEHEQNHQKNTVADLEHLNQRENINGAGKPPEPTSELRAPARSSWFGLWEFSTPSAQSEGNTQMAPKADSAEPSHSPVAAVPKTITTNRSQERTNQPNSESNRNSSGSWVFWSREKTRSEEKSDAKDETIQEVGQIAVAHRPSQSNPEPVQIKQDVVTQPSPDDSKSKKRERPISSEQPFHESSKRQAHGSKLQQGELQTDHKGSITSLQDSVLKTAPSRARRALQETESPKLTSKSSTNILLPVLRDSYHVKTAPSYWQQFSKLLGGRNDSRKHLSLSTTPPKIHRALAIGVHGYFPTPLVQRVLGAPTGTSIRFADGAADAIKKWTVLHGQTCTIEKAALEGEGMIADRVDTLWKLLLNWIDSIRKADFVLLACHSQGVPVAVSLVARLINFGCVSSARIGICAMAGINLGPFLSYQPQSRFFGGAASELYDFCRPNSSVSESYTAALKLLLKHHVRIVYIGSIDDQLVSLESATFANISHPYIYRAVFVDGRIHAPDFLTHLVGFALKLRNLGISDHGLVRELSGPLAGSLYTGEGHSRIYEDQAVYELAVEHAMETASLDSRENPELESSPYEALNSATQNPYILPWSMRGVLEEEFVKTELNKETDTLLSMFENWNPQTKVLKDVKFRLEAVKSKL